MRSAERRTTSRSSPITRSSRIPRIGFGYDVHAFVDGRPLMLGGVCVHPTRGLLGHSDADVLLHAVCDALLGAAALGDIGKHFPDTDERFKGISSLELLRHVSTLVEDAGYVMGNIDVTLLLETPKIAPFVEQMCGNVSVAAGIPKNCVSIKATTNEGLGAIGRKEGCAAMAVALVIARNRKAKVSPSLRKGTKR